MEDDSTVVASYIFRGIEYVVTMAVEPGRSLVVEVEDRLTADQWRGVFDVAYIEDLTHKTGNYKQFAIFNSMLESAITQGSDTVSLDLLTYSDLESLRSRKAGVGTRNIPPAKNQAALNSKRYLILTYTVEFDRIHYPLPLPYMGKPDPRALQETVRQLRQDVRTLKSQSAKDSRTKELEKLRKDHERALAEKEDIEEEYLQFRRQVGNTREGSAAKEIRILKDVIKNLEDELLLEKNKQQKTSFRRNQEYQKQSQELDELRASERNLKARVRSLTNELAVYKRQNTSTGSGRRSATRTSLSRERGSSRDNSYRDTSRLSNRSRESRNSRENSRLSTYSRHSRESAKSSRENSRLSKEGSFSKDKNRSNQSRNSGYWSRNGSLTRDRSSSLPRDRSHERPLSRGSSRERPVSARDNARPSSRDRWGSRERSSSWERTMTRDRSSSRGRTTERRDPAVRNRTPSPLGSPGYMRFNPTAFVKEKERKKKEAALKQKRGIKSRMVNGEERPAKSTYSYTDRRKPSSRSSSVGSFRSRTSSIESLSDILPSDASDAGQRRRKPVMKNGHISNIPSSPDVSFTKPPNTKKIYPLPSKNLASTPESEPRSRPKVWQKENRKPTNGNADPSDFMYFDRSEEISEIDDRLNRLQEFMKNNLQC